MMASAQSPKRKGSTEAGISSMIDLDVQTIRDYNIRECVRDGKCESFSQVRLH
jgi:hypothetical protein